MFWLGLLGIFIFSSLCGLNQTICKFMTQYMTVTLIVGLRSIIAGGWLIGCSLFQQKSHSWLLDRNVTLHVINGALFRTFLPNFLGIWALQHLHVAKVVLLLQFKLFFSYGLSTLLLHETITWRKTTGLVIGFCSIIPLIASKLPEMFAQKGGSLLPELAALSAAFFMSVGWNDMRKLVTQRKHISQVTINGFDTLIGGILGVCIAYLIGQMSIPQATLQSRPFWIGFSTSILITAFAFRILQSWLLKHYSEPLMTLVANFALVFAALSAWTWFGEKPGIETLISFFLVLTGFSIFYNAEMKEKVTVAMKVKPAK